MLLAGRSPGHCGQEQLPSVLPAQEKQPLWAEKLAGKIRSNSAAAQLTPYQSLLQEPLSVEFSITPAELEKAFEQMLSCQAYEDIVELKGDKHKYYYSNQKISANYARMLFTMEERDICTTIAEITRFECKTYPRPYPVQSLRNLPYCYTPEQINAALEQIKHKAQLQDIQPVYASNNALYLFSTQFMSQAYARGLCEWIEVEQYENP